MAKSTTRKLVKKAVRKTHAPESPLAPKEKPPGLEVTNAGKASVDVVDWRGGRETLAVGKRTVTRPSLLGVPGEMIDAAAPFALAARSLILVSLESTGAAKVTVAATSLRGTAALYGAPEMILLREKSGSRVVGESITLEVRPGHGVTVLVVGRGPVLNLGAAIQSLFRPRHRGEEVG